MVKKGIHYLILLGIVALALGTWGRSLYHSFKYSKEPAPEAMSLESIMTNVTRQNIEANLENVEDESDKEIETQADQPTAPATEETEDEGLASQGQIVITEPEAKPLPPAILNIDMPFYAQAPHANWDLPYQEACEEASVLLVKNLYKNHNWTADQFDQEILKIVEWEKQKFGDYLHTDVEQTVTMVEEYLGLNAKVHEDPSFLEIQQILAKGHLIVAPFAGKKLKNPFYTNGGPRYHMMVVKGYDDAKQQVVTHDVGTRRGANYVYSWERFNEALHDWHDKDMNLGDKKVIEIWP